ncbi:glycosyl hydrolase BNR repeat-containing protein [Streptomyces laurentii]|uniref:Glycosyl hydrolase BNR repeat-containing protein n=1 Tax=Streptomyces laurentii TaxID=39478 RepID=A0A160NV93_STRLU|nr:glycosyl hydrolase BNR repeat-containing protein [Streptomyces laurentii]
MTDVLLTVGTRKGLFTARRQNGRWSAFDAPHFNAQAIYSIGIDTRRARPRILVGGDSAHFGPSVFHSDDLGATWTEPPSPAVGFPEDTGASVERVWQLHPAPAHSPDVVYAGTEPAALFRSADGGESFELVRPLWEHPTRDQWVPGGGGEAVHTVVTDARDPDAVTVAVSAAGVFRSRDGGASWDPANRGVSAVFLPDQYPEFGQCVHKVAQDAGDLDRLYLQNHWGVFRSDDGGTAWTSIGDELPSDFGFAVVAHPHRPDTAYVFPINADIDRVPAGRRCRVYRTSDAGATWEPLTRGLPEGDHYGTVLRDAMCADGADPAGLYFGNRNGEVYASADDGDSWQLLGEHLPDVLCVRAAVLG